MTASTWDPNKLAFSQNRHTPGQAVETVARIRLRADRRAATAAENRVLSFAGDGAGSDRRGRGGRLV